MLRLILALGVVADHVAFYRPFFFIRGGVAVILFFIISGFYMSMVIKEKYQPSGRGWELRFLAQRALRLLPSYWAVLAFTVAFYAAIGQPNVFTSDMGLQPLHHALVLISNISVIGLDVLVSADTLLYPVPPEFTLLWNRYPVFIGWTVGVEMTFYVFAALFALRSRRDALIALGLGVYLRVYFLVINAKFLGQSEDGIGYSNMPWGYQFFGIALVFFMLGWVSYRIYVWMRDRLKDDASFIWTVRGAAAVTIAAFLIEAYAFDAFGPIEDYNDYRVWMAVAIFPLLIPPLFILTKRSKIDSYIGQYSYPVYLVHYMAATAGTQAFGLDEQSQLLNLALVMGAAALLVHLVELPIEKLRHGLWQTATFASGTSRSIK